MIEKYMICKLNIKDVSEQKISEYLRSIILQLRDNELFTKQYFIPTHEQTSINFVTINTETGIIHSTCNKDELITWNDIKLLQYLDQFEKIITNKETNNVQTTK